VTSARDWDATTYDRISAPQQTWAAREALGDRAIVSSQDLAELTLPEDLRERFVDTVTDRLDRPVVLDYVRLNMTATRAA
jgi:hypothetical protein